MRLYFGFSFFVIAIAAITLAAANWPGLPIVAGTDSLQGTLVGALFGAFAGVPLKEILDRRSKILLLELLADEYRQRSALEDPAALAKLEARCEQLTEKILGI